MTNDLNDLVLEARAVADAVQRQYEIACANYDGIPYLQLNHNVWGFHTQDKIPVSYAGMLDGWPLKELPDKGSYMRINYPDAWTNFTNILAARERAHQRLVGPTLAITSELNLIVIDLDSPKRALESFIKKKQKEGKLIINRTDEEGNQSIDEMKNEQRIITNWAISVGAWIEFSMSGEGVHILVFGNLPHHKYDLFHGSIFTAKQLLHMTGKLHPQSNHAIPLVQGGVDELMHYLVQWGWVRPVRESPALIDIESVLDKSTTFGRSLDLTDQEVIDALPSKHRASADAYAGKNGRTGNWSNDTYILISTLDKITGDPDQVKRVLKRSPRMQIPGRAESNGADRWVRTFRLFDHTLAKCRKENDVELQRRLDQEIEIRRLQARDIQFPTRSLSPAERRAEIKRAVAQAEAELVRRDSGRV